MLSRLGGFRLSFAPLPPPRGIILRAVQPTQCTLSVLLYLLIFIAGGLAGVVAGVMHFGTIGGIIGAVIGLFVGHVVGNLPYRLETKLLFREIERSSDEELWQIVKLGLWNFYQTMALLKLAARGHDVRGQLPRIIEMLESNEELTRIYGWDALRLVFNEETRAIGDYDPRASTEVCFRKVQVLKERTEGLTEGDTSGDKARDA